MVLGCCRQDEVVKTVDPFAEEPVEWSSADSLTQNQAIYLKECFDASLKDVEDRQAVFNDALKFVIRSLQAELRALKTDVVLRLGVQHSSEKIGAASTLQMSKVFEATTPTSLASDVHIRSAAKDRAPVRTRIVNLDSCEPETPELSHEPANLEPSQFGALPSLRDLVRSECEVVNARIFHELEKRLHKFDNELQNQGSQGSVDSMEHTAEEDEIGRFSVVADDQAPAEDDEIGPVQSRMSKISTFHDLNVSTERRFSVRMGHVHDPVKQVNTTELEDDIEFAMACFVRE